MTIVRLLAIAFGALLLLRLFTPIIVLFVPRLREKLHHTQVVLDVAGSLILLLIIASVWWRGRPEIALVVAVLGIPVFIGTYRALPAWWRGWN